MVCMTGVWCMRVRADPYECRKYTKNIPARQQLINNSLHEHQASFSWTFGRDHTNLAGLGCPCKKQAMILPQAGPG